MPTKETIQKELEQYELERTFLAHLAACKMIKADVIITALDDLNGRKVTVSFSEFELFPLSVFVEVKQLLKKTIDKYSEQIQDIKAVTATE